MKVNIDPQKDRTNQELAVIKLTEEVIQEVVDKQWATGEIVFSSQAGKIVSLRKKVEQTLKIGR